MAMFISLTKSGLNGYKKWSDQHPRGSTDDNQPTLGAFPPVAIAVPLILLAQADEVIE
jgi:hypothetical protein